MSFESILPGENHQDVVEILSGDDEANVVANLDKKALQIEKLK